MFMRNLAYQYKDDTLRHFEITLSDEHQPTHKLSMFMCLLNTSLILLLMTSYCSEQQEHGCLHLAVGTAQHPVATSGVSLGGKSGLCIAGAWLFASGSWDSTRHCGYPWRFSRGKMWPLHCHHQKWMDLFPIPFMACCLTAPWGSAFYSISYGNQINLKKKSTRGM